MNFMKRLFLPLAAMFVAISAYSQPQMACYLDTSLVDEFYGRKDTSWAVKPQYQKGDWNLYWDFALTKIKSEYHYDNNADKIGVWREYYKNGQMSAEWSYDGAVLKFYPPGKEWFNNGKIKTERVQTADTITETRYHANGKILSLRKWDKSGKWILSREWCDNGQLMIDYVPTSDVVIQVKKYHCNGNVAAEYGWYTFGYVGKYKEFHSNGKISVDGQFTEKPANVAAFMARKTGTWTYYDDKGKVIKTEKWDNGRLVK